MNYSSFEMSGPGLSVLSGEPLAPRAPFFRVLVFFPVPPLPVIRHSVQGLVVATAYHLVLLHNVLVAFLHGPRAFEKTGFCQKRNFEKI